MQIIVHIAAAKQSITLEIDNSSSTIESVKNVIKKRKEGKKLPMDKLDLVFQGTILEDGRMLSYYNIQDGSTLNTAFQLRGETVQVIVIDLTRKRHGVEIGESDTLDDLMKIVEDVYQIPPYRQRLIVACKQLNKGVILDQMRLIQSEVLESGDQVRIDAMYDCNGRPTIDLVLRLSGGGNVVHHRVKWADASNSPTAIKIVKYVETGCKSRSVGCWASLANTQVISSLFVFCNGIVSKSCNGCMWRSKGKGGIETMQIIVHIAAAKQSITLEIDNSSSTIENIKKVIKNREEGKELPMDELDLVFQGTILEEGKTLSYYNIQDGSTLNMAFQLRGETVQVFLEDRGRGRTWTIETIGESDTLDDLKKKIEDLFGVELNHDRQRFWFFAECLKEEGVILDQMRLIQSKVLESGDQERIDDMYDCNARPTIRSIFRLLGNRQIEWADGSSSPRKRSSLAIKIDDASDDNVMDSNDASDDNDDASDDNVMDSNDASDDNDDASDDNVMDSNDASDDNDNTNDDNVMNSNDHASRPSGSSSMSQHVSSEKGKGLLFDEEFNSKLNLLAEVYKEDANSLKGDDWDRLTSSLRVVPNISRKKVLDAVDLFEEKPTLIRIFLSLNPQEKEEWLVRKLGY